MTIISSHRPHAQGGQFPLNQIRAYKSWLTVAKKIIYFGSPEPDLGASRQNTQFIGCPDFPQIAILAAYAASCLDTVAIVNSDIVLTEPVLKIPIYLSRGICKAAVSRRHHYDPGTFDLAAAVDITTDRGRDIFIAEPVVWREVAKRIPSVYRIGHQKWDAWVCDYWRDTHKKKFMDFTHLRCVFHPNHGERRMPYSKELEAV